MKEKKRYYRTVLKVEILSEDEPWNGSLQGLAFDVAEGSCSGENTITLSEEVSSAQMATLLHNQGSDPSFFCLDDEGNELNLD